MSETITLTHEGMASTVTITSPPFNLLDIETMDKLVEVHREADAHPETRVIVTRSGLEGMFCNGLNPMTVLQQDIKGRIEIFKAVGRMVAGLYALAKPHIAVINGPAMAGGAVLAVLADFRYFDQDRGVICFAEAKVGVPVPSEMVAIIAGVCSPAWLREVVMLGKNMKAPDALASGLADGLAPAAELDALVEKQVARLSRLSLDVVKACKASIRAPILSKGSVFMADGDGDGFAGFLGPDYLEEGLKAYLEGRQPVFRR